MASLSTSRSLFKYLFIVGSILIAGLSVWITQVLVERLSEEERVRMELWASATRELIEADVNADLGFVQQVIESNHTIPVILADAEGNALVSRNTPTEDLEALNGLVSRYGAKHEPIVIVLEGGMEQYIYYDDSRLLRELSFFPIVQVGVILVFLLLVLYAFYTIQKEEKNKVWVGLSRETAHQLGTPISSLLAWKELLKERYPGDGSLDEVGKDIDRLSMIADRFSKIGSRPELQVWPLGEAINQAVDYVSHRVSSRVRFVVDGVVEECFVRINYDLFSWVVENLCKNAIDAMDGEGEIHFSVTCNRRYVTVDVSDTGKGIPKSKQDAVFIPGYTTKQRGWGLGLSLAKRIVEEYHHGKIFVKSSEVGVGTTFSIVLRRA